MDMLRASFASVAPEKTRILVTHHPLFAMPIGKGGELSEAVGRHEDAVRAAAEAGIHIALAGHFHRTYAEAADRMVAHAGGAQVGSGEGRAGEECVSTLRSRVSPYPSKKNNTQKSYSKD